MSDVVTPLFILSPPYDLFGAVIRAFNDVTGESATVEEVQTSPSDWLLSSYGIVPGNPLLHAFRQKIQYLFHADLSLDVLGGDETTLIAVVETLAFAVANGGIFPMNQPSASVPSGPVTQE